MTVDEASDRLKKNFDDTFPFFILKDYCEADWYNFYKFIKEAKIVTVALDGGFYFRTEEDYLIALMLK